MRVEVNMEDPGKSGEYVYDPAELTFERGQQVTFCHDVRGRVPYIHRPRTSKSTFTSTLGSRRL